MAWGPAKFSPKILPNIAKHGVGPCKISAKILPNIAKHCVGSCKIALKQSTRNFLFRSWWTCLWKWTIFWGENLERRQKIGSAKCKSTKFHKSMKFFKPAKKISDLRSAELFCGPLQISKITFLRSKAVNREDKRCRRYRDRDFGISGKSRRYRDR